MNKRSHNNDNALKKIIKAPFITKTFATLGERLLLSKHHECSAPQLFILGLPRSGTTLIYQYIAHRLNVSYFTFGVGKHPYAPCITTLAQRKLHGHYSSSFESHYGKDALGNAVAPREAGVWWNRFFDKDNYVELDNLEKKQIRQIRNTIACVQNIFGGMPFINKNVKHLLRIEALGQIFPNSKFLIVERDIEDVAISILRGRHENLLDASQWWSVRPPDYAELVGLPVEKQIARQCISLKQKMEVDLSKLPNERVIRIQYKDFCNAPEDLVRKIISAIDTSETGNPKQPLFKISRSCPQTQEEIALIELIGELNK